MTTQQPTSNPQPTGWPRSEFFDDRDKYYVPARYFDLKSLSPLNLREHKTYKGNFLPFYNQSPAETSLDYQCWGTCVANATAAAFAYEWNRQGLQPPLHPSRLFIYFNSRQLEFDKSQKPSDDPTNKNPGEQGTFIRVACKVLEKMGVCDEDSLWGYSDAQFATPPSLDVMHSALHTRAVQYSRLDPDQPEGFEKQMDHGDKEVIGAMTLLRLRQCLGEGYPVIFGFKFYCDPKDHKWTRDTLEASRHWDLGPLPGRNGPNAEYGGHAVLAIGFDDEHQRVLCQNSWGDGKDANGREVTGAPLFWMHYDWIKDFEATSDFWMIRLVEREV